MKIPTLAFVTIFIASQVACAATTENKVTNATAAPISTSGSKATLEVTVSGVKEQSGTIRVALFDSEESFQKEPFKSIEIPVESDSASFSFEDLPVGQYAVMLFHDVNSNEVMETNLLGIPSEPWGASLLGTKLFGPPRWKHTQFTHGETGTVFDIELR